MRLGATVEFMTAREIAAQYKIHNQIIGGGWLHLKPGGVTDDTEMALALGSALIASGSWNLRAIADSFATWMRGDPPDIGNACRRGISNYISNGSLCVPPAENNGGNGAAMRNLPTVFVSLENEELLIQRSIEQAHLTHNHPKSDSATSALACMTRRLLLEGEQAACDQIAADLIARHPDFNFKPWPGKTSGYIVDTVQTVFDGFFNTGSFEECLGASRQPGRRRRHQRRARRSACRRALWRPRHSRALAQKTRPESHRRHLYPNTKASQPFRSLI